MWYWALREPGESGWLGMTAVRLMVWFNEGLVCRGMEAFVTPRASPGFPG